MMSSVTRVAHAMALVAGAALLATAFLVSIEVVLRHVFLVSMNAGSEISSYVLGIASTWGFGYTLLMRGHVRVDALVRLLPARSVAWIDLAALAGLGLVAALFLWQGFITFAASWSLDAHSMTPLHVPIWLPQALWVLGFVFFMIVVFVLFIRALGFLVAGQFRKSHHLIGIQDTAAEAAEVIAETRELMGTHKAGAR